MNSDTTQNEAPKDIAKTDEGLSLSVLVVTLLKGVIYQENDSLTWASLLKLQSRIRDFVSVLGVELILDEAEGYAFLKSPIPDDEDNESSVNQVPRLMPRRQLSFPVSLILALLRKKLAEFDATGGDTRLVLSRDEIVEIVRVFFPAGTNDAKLVTQIDTHLNKIVDMGFLRKLKSQHHSHTESFEVKRILKAFVDAQWLSDFDARMEQYKIKALADTTAGGV